MNQPMYLVIRVLKYDLHTLLAFHYNSTSNSFLPLKTFFSPPCRLPSSRVEEEMHNLTLKQQ